MRISMIPNTNNKGYPYATDGVAELLYSKENPINASEDTLKRDAFKKEMIKLITGGIKNPEEIFKILKSKGLIPRTLNYERAMNRINDQIVEIRINELIKTGEIFPKNILQILTEERTTN